ncbi:MAG: DNRLRE domain-containing protein, partial [Desulfobacterales bacterium]|nr:DNRLRE domain-containing protein [Desulfobacterales bacterium]
ESPDFANASWQEYAPAPTFLLSEGAGLKTVYFKVKNDSGESDALSDAIEFQEPGAAALSFSSDSYTVNESDGAAAITVNLSSAGGSPITVDYTVSDGTATAGQDYTATSGTLTFAPGETTKTFTVPILDDGVLEPDETVMLALSNPENAAPGEQISAILTIIDDDAPSPAPEGLFTGYPSAQTGAPDPVDFTDATPFFSAINRHGEAATAVQIQLTLAGDAGYDAPIWDSGDIPVDSLGDGAASTVDNGARIPDVFYGMGAAPSAILEQGRTYTWRIRTKAGENYSDWSSNGAISMRDAGDLTARFYSHKDTYYGTYYYTDGRPDDKTIIVGGWGDWYFGYIEWNLTFAPRAQSVIRAEMNLFGGNRMVNDPVIKIRRVTSPWLETEVSKANHPSETDVGEISIDHPVPDRYNLTDVSEMFVGWQNGSYGNYGLKLHSTQNAGGTLLHVYSKDQPGIDKDPYLEVVYNPAVLVSFSSETHEVSERDGAAVIAVTLSAPGAETITVDYAATDGTATAGEDYAATSGTLTLAPGETEKTFSVSILDNGIEESNETIMLALSNPVNASLDAKASSVLTIIDDDSPWKISTIDSDGRTGRCISLSLDKDQQPGISYSTEELPQKIKFARLRDGVWSTETITTCNGGNLGTSSAFDSRSFPRVVFDDYRTRHGYSEWNGASWETHVFSTLPSLGDLQIDGSDQAHIAWYAGSSLEYRVWDGSNWRAEIVDSSGDVGYSARLVLDDDGRKYISYAQWGHRLKFAVFDGASWSVEFVDASIANANNHHPTVLDNDGNPVILYLDGDQSVQLATRIDGQWQFKKTPLTSPFGWNVGMVVDASNGMHISCCQVEGDVYSVTYYHYDGAEWRARVVDRFSSTETDRIYTDLALSPDGAVHIAYTDGANYDLKYAVMAPSDAPVLSVAPSSRQVPAPGGSTTFTVENTGGGEMSWTATSGAAWLTIENGESGTGAGVITARFEANPGDARVGAVTVSSGDATNGPISVEVRQAADEAPALVWKKTNGVYLKSRPALGDDGFLYTKAGPTASHENSGITAIDPSDGSVVWGPMIPPGCDSGGRTFGGVATVGANHV